MNNEDGNLYMFVVVACDGRHEGKHGTWEEAHADAAKWLGRDVEWLLSSYDDPHPREVWEGGSGQVTRVEMVGAHAALMNGECDEDES